MEEIKRRKGIGIIIPSFQPKDYIKKCLDSLNFQTFDKNKFKVYVILNGEKGEYYRYLNKLSQTVSINIQIMHTFKKGVSHARNLGIEANEYEYILFLDDDDFLSKNFLKDIYEYRKSDGIVFSNTINLNFKGEKENGYLETDFLKNYKNKNINLFNSRKQFSNSCGKLISSKIIANIRYKENLSIGEDSLFMSMFSNKIKTLCYSDKEIIYFRNIRNDSASQSKVTVKKIKNDIFLIFYYTILIFKGYKTFFILSRILGTIKRNLKFIKVKK